MARRAGPVGGITGRVTGDDKRVMRQLRHLEKKAVPTSRRRALNRAIQSAQTKAVRGTAAELDVPQKYIKNRFSGDGAAKGKRVRLFKANAGNQDAAIYLYTRGIPLIQLGAKDTMHNGVKLRHYKQWNLELQNAFVPAQRRAGAINQVFTRKGKGRLPVKVEKIDDWYQFAHKHFSVAVRTVGPVFVKEFERQLTLRASRKR